MTHGHGTQARVGGGAAGMSPVGRGSPPRSEGNSGALSPGYVKSTCSS